MFAYGYFKTGDTVVDLRNREGTVTEVISKDYLEIVWKRTGRVDIVSADKVEKLSAVRDPS